MDRDVSKALLDVANGMKTALQSIVSNLYGARITTQPVDTEGAIDATVTFSVVAENVEAYQWFYKTSPTSLVWATFPTQAYKNSTFSVTVNSDTYQRLYKCEITGKDGKRVISNIVKVTEPEET